MDISFYRCYFWALPFKYPGEVCVFQVPTILSQANGGIRTPTYSTVGGSSPQKSLEQSVRDFYTLEEDRDNGPSQKEAVTDEETTALHHPLRIMRIGAPGWLSWLSFCLLAQVMIPGS